MQDELNDADKSGLLAGRGELEMALGKISQVLADLYRQASQLVEQSEYSRAIVSLISHAVREISNNLAYHLGLAEDVPLPPRVDLTGAMANLTQLHEARSQWDGTPPEGNSDAKPDNLTEGSDYSIQLRQAVQEAVDAHSAATGNAKRLRAFVAAWELSTDPNPTAAMFGSAFEFFMSYAHLDRVGQDRTPPKEKLQEQFATFETIVAARLRGFFDVGDELVAILAEANATGLRSEPDLGQGTATTESPQRAATGYTAPSSTEVDSAVARTGHLQHRRVFYSKLENPHWVAPLTKRGVFKTAPQVDGRSQVSMDGWPEGEYLIKVATLAPDKVLNAVEPALSSDHPVVQRIVLDLAGQLPVEMVVSILPTIRRYLQLPWLPWLDPVKLVAVIRRLAEGSRAKQARALAQSLYQPRPAANPTADPETTLEPYWYAKTLPDTVAVLGTEPKTIATVVGWLQEWVKAAPYQTYTMSMWRHSIAGEAQLPHSEAIGHALVDSIRDLAHALVDAGYPLSDVVRRVELKNLEPDGAPIFRRLAVDAIAYKLRSGPDEATECEDLQTAFEHLIDPELLRGQYRPEYLLLTRSALPVLAVDQVESWKNLIADPPHLTAAAIGKMLGGFTDEHTEASAEQVADYVSRWQWDLLTSIGRESLPGALHTWLDELITRHGKPPTPLHSQIRNGFATRPASPLSDADAVSLSPETLVDLARTWQPSDVLDWQSMFPPSYEGLASSITRAVMASPARYAAHAEQFIGLRSSYIRALFDGLQHAINQGQGFGWEPVLTLASYAADQSGNVGDGETWDFTQQQVARFIQHGIDTDPAQAIPADHYPAAWQALERLTRSTDPGAQNGDEVGSESADALTESVNTTRPVALRAAIHLLAACGNLPVDKSTDGSEGNATSITEEILAALDGHVGPEADGSLAVAAVFGEGIGPLLSAAPQWTITRLERIFGPADGSDTIPTHRAWFDTAWAVTIIGYEPSRGLFEPLKLWYSMHIRQLGTDRPDVVAGISMRSPRQALADHILMLYVSGQFDNGLHDQALTDLFAHGDSTLLRDALGQLGWRLHRTEGTIPETVLDRLRALWDWRAARIVQAGTDPEELLDFYWWVASGRLRATWWLPHLVAVASDPRFHAHEMLGGPLAEVAGEDPEQVFAIFSALYSNSRQTRQSPDLITHAPAILMPALNAERPGLAERAQALAGQMGQDGYTDLMERIRALRD